MSAEARWRIVRPPSPARCVQCGVSELNKAVGWVRRRGDGRAMMSNAASDGVGSSESMSERRAREWIVGWAW